MLARLQPKPIDQGIYFVSCLFFREVGCDLKCELKLLSDSHCSNQHVILLHESCYIAEVTLIKRPVIDFDLSMVGTTFRQNLSTSQHVQK